MPRPLILLVAFSLCTASVYGQEATAPSPAVKRILDKAFAEVKKNRQEFDKANQKPLGDARVKLQDLSTKLIKDGKTADATAVLKQIETLDVDVMRMAKAPAANLYGQQVKAPPPAVKSILDKALVEVKKNLQEFDNASQRALGQAKEELQELVAKLKRDGKRKEVIDVLKQIEKLEPEPPLSSG